MVNRPSAPRLLYNLSMAPALFPHSDPVVGTSGSGLLVFSQYDVEVITFLNVIFIWKSGAKRNAPSGPARSSSDGGSLQPHQHQQIRHSVCAGFWKARPGAIFLGGLFIQAKPRKMNFWKAHVWCGNSRKPLFKVMRVTCGAFSSTNANI